MNFLAATMCALVGAGIVGCVADAKLPPPEKNSTGQASTVGSEAAVDPSCPIEGAERDEVVRGACVKGAECRFSTPGGPAACRPGRPVVPVTASQWRCTCVDAIWACNVTSGGFGVLQCPDAGSDAGP